MHDKVQGKLYFRHGVMGSSKTLNLLATAHNYESLGHKVITMKPAVDIRYGECTIKTRAGIEREADFIIRQDYQMPVVFDEVPTAILVDEAQFLSAYQVELLRRYTLGGTDVFCYGLRTNFKGKLFEGSKRLMELADEIEEIKSICAICGRGAAFNHRINSDGFGEEVLIGDDMYKALCYRCYQREVV